MGAFGREGWKPLEVCMVRGSSENREWQEGERVERGANGWPGQEADLGLHRRQQLDQGLQGTLMYFT